MARISLLGLDELEYPIFILTIIYNEFIIHQFLFMASDIYKQIFVVIKKQQTSKTALFLN